VRNLPTGTVTFLFTDIEGSTRLLDELGDGYADVLADHHRKIRGAIESHAGVEVDTQGDAFFVAFRRASDAVAAAAAAQEALADGVVRVRMGIHTGEPTLAGDGYIGMDVHRAARVMSAGHGGQVLVSQTTRDLLDAAFDLRDLGEHRLKDLSAPQRLFQFGDREFPPLKTLHRTNLPVQPTPLVGREPELRAAAGLLREHRLITFVGPGGSGKTRLALQLAAESVEAFEDGVYWVPLQAVADADLVVPAIAESVGSPDGVAEFLRGRRALLLLDNLEQVLAAASAIGDLLATASELKIVATSREPLRLAAERRFPVDPLPDGDAQRLFVERARGVVPDFEPTPEIAEICRRLDGLPLALELAAARAGLLGPTEMLARLERALPLLTGGARDAPERQQTLRGTIEWSYELLDEEERRAFRALGVFAGSFDFDAAEAVAAAGLDALQSLLDKSLLRRWESGRLGMLETIHEYAREHLGPEERAELGRRHAEYYRDVAWSANLSMEAEGPENVELARRELPNFRAALAWALEAHEVELGLAFVAALEQFWVYAGPFEGARWADAFLSLAGDVDPALRAAALRAHGGHVYIVGDYERGVDLYEQSLELFRSIGDERGASHLLHRIALEAARKGENAKARELANEALALSRAQGDLRSQAVALAALAQAAEQDGDLATALELYTESRDRAVEAGFTWWSGTTLLNMADAAGKLGRTEDAWRWLREALDVLRPTGDRQWLVYALAFAARLAAERGWVEHAGLIWGAIESEEERGPLGQWEAERADHAEPVLAHAGPEFERGREQGRALPLDVIVERALSAR